MRQRYAVLAMISMTVILAGCTIDSTEPPPPPTSSGIDFGMERSAEGSHMAEGTLSADDAPLEGEFAVAVRDSLDGLVFVSYDAEAANLFILQVRERVSGEYACGPVELGAACHGRLFENVRLEDGNVHVDGRLDVTSGLIGLTVSGTRVTGTFEAEFARTYPEGGGPGFAIDNGTVAVELLPGTLENAGLDCLIRLAGSAESCQP